MRVPTTDIRPDEITPLMEARFWELVEILKDPLIQFWNLALLSIDY
jgi:hypothetical protein